MIDLFSVTDSCELYGRDIELLENVDFHIPAGRYALLSHNPEHRRLVMDVIGGLRPPRSGAVQISGSISWPIGRSAMLRSKTSGIHFVNMVADLHGLDRHLSVEFVTSLMSRPDYLSRALYSWPPFLRQDFSFALSLLPEFDIYLVDSMMPSEDSRFTRLWQALFEQRLVGKTLILSSYRPKQLLDYCAKALVVEGGRLEIVSDLEQCLERFPVRPARGGVEDSGNAGAEDGPDFLF